MKYFRVFSALIVLGLLVFGGFAGQMVMNMMGSSWASSGWGHSKGAYEIELPAKPKLNKSDLPQCQEGTVGKSMACFL